MEEATSSLATLHPGREKERERDASHHQGVTLTNALTAAQELHAEAKKLPADVRAVYLQEIKDVGALFAYTDPETSILKGFLEQRRRIALAEQVNAAILCKYRPESCSCGKEDSSDIHRAGMRPACCSVFGVYTMPVEY